MVTKNVLIAVRTYPTPARKGVEVSCTAGVTDEGKWIRLFPLPYRRLERSQQFTKYDWISVDVHKASDARQESYNPHCDSIAILPGQHVGTERGWEARKKIIAPLKAHCLCCLKKAGDDPAAPTLGVFKPAAIKRFYVRKGAPNWTADQLASLRQTQMDLFPGGNVSQQELEKIPYNFSYSFQCDEASCRGHDLLCTDWELAEAYRRWRSYGPKWETQLRKKFETEMIEKFDTHFYVGTVHRYPGTWIIVGLFYPPRTRKTADTDQGRLF